MANLECCRYCGKFVVASESILRQGVDNQPELVCNSCYAIEQTLSNEPDALKVASKREKGRIVKSYYG